MVTKLTIQKNRYVDSVTLMQVRSKAMKVKGAVVAEVQMATPANIDILKELGFEVPAGAGPNDLICGITAEDEASLEKVQKTIEDAMDHKVDDEVTFTSLDEIDFAATGFNLVQISLPGEYAAEEAKKAISYDCDVFIFSDNVSVEEELEIKEFGRAHGKLVMGPDCGVGLVDGICLGVGSIVRRGEIGIVGASGSGSQEVACVIEKCGYGVTDIIGTGGRDLAKEIGGITMIEGIKRLEADPDTKVIALVSKLANTEVMEKVLTFADGVSKPVVAVFLGGDESLFEGHKVRGSVSLEGAGLLAVEALTGKKEHLGYTDEELAEIAKSEIAKLSPEQTNFRGLFCGGTFTEESLIYFSQHNADNELHTNLHNKYAKPLADHDVSVGNSILDLGAEDFTAIAPHPVFDSSLRVARLRKELEDPTVAVVMIDFITGPAVDEDPFTDIAAVAKEVNASGRHVVFIGAVCGSESDPQDVKTNTQVLRDSGFIVTGSNYQSTKLASMMMTELGRR